ncbi:MAG: DUF2284 domain-containing protein [Nitrospiraceae bacterium]|nr:DUF2284 domain-containing protein [Nitrospiraceae bacterium]
MRTFARYNPQNNCDPQDSGFQQIEDLATSYWLSETLFAAVELGIFTFFEPHGMTLEELSRRLRIKKEPLARFLNALCQTGLIGRAEKIYFNSLASARYLVSGNPDYMGDSVLWRKELRQPWAGLRDCLKKGGRKDFLPSSQDKEIKKRRRQYMRAMDAAARGKIKVILPLLGSFPLEGEMLDVGCGSGAISAGFLEHAPSLKATLMDLPEILELTGKMMHEKKRASLCPANVLAPWPFEAERFSLIVLSNIIHAYSKKELSHIIENAARCLSEKGLLIIHDFFHEHRPDKASLFDLNMFINTFNGMVFSYDALKKELEDTGLSVAGLAPLESDTALVFASKDLISLQKLCLDKTSGLINRILAIGFRNAVSIRASDIHIPGWTNLKCRYGCAHYGKKPNCPPNSITEEETKALINDCRTALLLEGEPPSRDFQLKVLKAEKEAFNSGFYKAFSFWAGPCSLCSSCKTKCVKIKDPDMIRPSMEGAGIDVFETVKRAGIKLKTLRGKDEYAKYFALLLLE